MSHGNVVSDCAGVPSSTRWPQREWLLDKVVMQWAVKFRPATMAPHLRRGAWYTDECSDQNVISVLGVMQNVCLLTLIVFTLQSVARILFLWSTTFSAIWVSRRPLMLSRWKNSWCALCALFALFDCRIFCVLSGPCGAQYCRLCVERY